MSSLGFLKRSSQPVVLVGGSGFSKPRSVEWTSGPESDDIGDTAPPAASWLSSRPPPSFDVELGGTGRSNGGAGSSRVPFGGGGLAKDEPASPALVTPASPLDADALGPSRPELAQFRKPESSFDNSKLLSCKHSHVARHCFLNWLLYTRVRNSTNGKQK